MVPPRHRVRAQNFYRHEIELLVKLAFQYKHIICNMATNKEMAKRKEKAWGYITKKFNEQYGNKFNRSVDCIKTKWKNLMKSVRTLIKNGVDLHEVYHDVADKIIAVRQEMKQVYHYVPEIEENSENGIKVDQMDWEGNLTDLDNNDDDDDDGDSIIVPRHRGPVYTQEETETLVDLIDEYKYVLLNKSLNTSALQAKEKAWVKLHKKYNCKNFRSERSIENLKNKWYNLRKRLKCNIKNSVDDDYSHFDDLTCRVFKILQKAENDVRDTDSPHPEIDEYAETDDNSTAENDITNALTSDSCRQEDDTESEIKESPVRDSLEQRRDFTAEECRILLQCVRAEKKYLFFEKKHPNAIRLKNTGWRKVTDAFNSKCQNKRTTKVLRRKFFNLKYATLALNKGKDDTIKAENKGWPETKAQNELHSGSEPIIKFETEVMSNCDGDDDNHDHNGAGEGSSSEAIETDPLNISSTGGLDTECNNGTSQLLNESNNEEINRLRKQLLMYQVETAKMERKRVEDAIEAQRKEHESRALEMALRLRAARLATLAAESRFDPSDPTLLYIDDELLSREYLEKYRDIYARDS